MRRLIFRTLMLVAMAAGCAGSQRVATSRTTLGYTDHDHLFAVTLRDVDAAARGPSSGARGLAARMGGNVCGADIAYDAEYAGRFMSVNGFVTNAHSKGDESNEVIVTQHHTACIPNMESVALTAGQGDSRPVQLEVRDVVDGGVARRSVRGSIGETAGTSDTLMSPRTPPAHGVDLLFSRDELRGEVGLRNYHMVRRDDDFIGYFEMYGKKVPYIMRGADELWQMPAAAQAAILPLLLACTEETRMIQRVDLR